MCSKKLYISVVLMILKRVIDRMENQRGSDVSEYMIVASVHSTRVVGVKLSLLVFGMTWHGADRLRHRDIIYVDITLIQLLFRPWLIAQGIFGCRLPTDDAH